MKKKVDMEKVMKIAAPIIQKRTEAANEMVTGIAKQIIQDQQEWLDGVMKDLLPPHLYQAGKRDEMELEIGNYLHRHGIRIIFIPDRLVLRVMLGEKVHSQFVPKILCDGEEVHVKATGFVPDPTKN